MAAHRDPVQALQALIDEFPDIDELGRKSLSDAAAGLDGQDRARVEEMFDELEKASQRSGDQGGTSVIWFGYHFPRNKTFKEALVVSAKIFVAAKLSAGLAIGIALLDGLKTATELVTSLDTHGQTLCWVIGERQRKTGRGATLAEIEAAYARDRLDATLVPKLLADLSGKVLRTADAGGTWSYQLVI